MLNRIHKFKHSQNKRKVVQKHKPSECYINFPTKIKKNLKDTFIISPRLYLDNFKRAIQFNNYITFRRQNVCRHDVKRYETKTRFRCIKDRRISKLQRVDVLSSTRILPHCCGTYVYYKVVGC